MNYAVEMGSVAVIHIPSFIKISSGIAKFIWEGYTDTQHADLIKPTLFLKIIKVS
jgi:hypothetical protein